MELGLQSYCLRGFKDNDQAAARTRETGLRRIELCGVHTGWDDAAAFRALAKRYAENGVAVVSIGVNRISPNKEEARALFECAKAAGLSRMSVDFPLDEVDAAVAVADELTEEYGMVAGIHNHGGRHWLGSRTAIRWVFAKASPRVGLSLDTAWALDSREDPIEMVKEFGDRLHLVHLKDFVFEPDRTPRDVVVGTGNLSLPALDRALTDVGFAGEAILEYEGDVDDPVPALRECVSAVRGQMSLVTIPESE
ncbi:MAG: sugar phosphate isomerase/epimerase family protein [Spirochaetota bacterium]